ncbi:calpain-7 [Plakobranchus ocellatus]|uniref:Calpain-7 n=1 Tax=Plakobranchus ocellatus TaxID=259542 RepID=A0AAV4AJI0_9GAST|nr:calpain-7 [Plakobranchus ocellatus]
MADPSSGYHGADPQVLQNEGIHLAQQAVQHDQLGRFDMAVFYYSEAAQTLLAALQAGSQVPNIAEKAAEYMLRADALKKSLETSNKVTNAETVKSQHQTDLERAGFLLSEALDEDEQGNLNEAIDLYSEAVDVCLQIRNSNPDTKMRERVTKMAEQALDRAEALKKRNPKPSVSSAASPSSSGVRTVSGKSVPPLGFGAFVDDEDNTTTQHHISSSSASPKPNTKTFTPSGKKGLINVGPSSYSKEEIAVLRLGSHSLIHQYLIDILSLLKNTNTAIIYL